LPPLFPRITAIWNRQSQCFVTTPPHT
jgi:hypothetical protein